MSADDLKKAYLKWSRSVAIGLPAFLIAIVICDTQLGFDFSHNMYIMAIVATSVLLSIISLIWISVLNCKLFNERTSKEMAQDNMVKESMEERQEERKVEVSDIEFCIKKEGFVPVRRDNFISFKVSGEEIEVFYNDEKLSLVRTYVLDEDVNLEILSEACSILHDSTFLIRSSLHKYDNNQMGLVFEVQTMVSSPTELDRYFSNYLNLLRHGIERHRDIYVKLLENQATLHKEMPPSQSREQKVVS